MATLTCNNATDLNDFLFGEGGIIKVKSGYSTLLVVEDGRRKKQELIGRFIFRNWLGASGVLADINILLDWGQSLISSLSHYEKSDSVQFSISNLSIRGSDYLALLHDGAAVSFIEFLLSGHDNLNGSGEDDVLLGYDGNDNIKGFGGNDYMAGGGGSDRYWIDSVGDIVEEPKGEDFEIDRIYSSIDYVLPLYVEELDLSEGTAKYGTGNNLRNTLVGNGEDNILDGGGDEDIMDGGAGNDTYIIDNINDRILELASIGAEEKDIAVASCDYELPSNVEDLYIVGIDAFSASGNNSDNKIFGNIGNNRINGGKGQDTMAGGPGDDIYMVDEMKDVVTEELDSGIDLIISEVSLSLPDNVENITLIGDLAINATGNDSDNIITGSIAVNFLSGKKGNDVYYVSINDVVNELEGEGFDSIYSDASYTMPVNIEKLILIGGDDLSLFGNMKNNELIGNRGDNIIDGKEGADLMKGGDGDDIYYIDNDFDTIDESLDEGIDTAISFINYRTPSHVDKLILLGRLDLTGWGNDLDNSLSGNEGNNILYGGKGDDTYIISKGDLVVEYLDEGIDTILADINYELPYNVENLTLTGSSMINGTGNSLNNKIKGNDGSNLLAGGQGDDIYYVDQRDKVVEKDGEGVDTVFSMVTHELNEFTENLTLIGKKDANGIGNRHSNYISGNEGINMLFGKSGDDTYLVEANDKVIELEEDGFDTVLISDTYALPTNVECLLLGGIQNINAFGNDLNNILTGNSGDNLIDGGLGVDILTGLDGNDVYIVTEGDQIIEYQGGGFDIIYSKLTWILDNNIEALILLGKADINGVGNSGNNRIAGNQGVNQLYGGEGDDTFVIGIGDIVVENRGEGRDTVLSQVSYNADDNIEIICLTGSSNANVSGNIEDNLLKGNAGINEFRGDQGNDTYIIGSNDIVIEFANEGSDTIVSDQSVILFEFVENVVLRGYRNISCNGNSEDNVIKGNFGRNTLVGGYGNDIYYIGAGDIVVESRDSGTDSVISNCSYALDDNLEELSLIGSMHLNGAGNHLDNRLTGNSGKNCLVGAGGKDILTGGLGADIFRYDSVADSPVKLGKQSDEVVLSNELYWLEGSDIITDFRVVEGDRLDLRGIDADESLEGNQGFKFIGMRQFRGFAGELRFAALENEVLQKNAVVVSGDVNGDKLADFAIVLQGIRQMQDHWMLL